jgi:uncharacterized protein YjbJ (UPF0337 family)
MGRKSGGAIDRVTGELTETVGKISGDKNLQAEGRTVAREADRKTYVVMPRDGGSWAVMTGGASRATSVHGSKDEAVAKAKDLAMGKTPSQLLVYKKDGTVQTEQTYG